MNVHYSSSIEVDEVNALRKSIGFRQNHPEQIKAGLDGSACIVAAYEDGNVIGMARLIWDGGGTALIHDLIVAPDYQTDNIASELVTRILTFLRGNLKPGFGIQVDIKAWSMQERLLKDLGFQESTVLKRGKPMHICLTDQIELTDKMFKQMGYLDD